MCPVAQHKFLWIHICMNKYFSWILLHEVWKIDVRLISAYCMHKSSYTAAVEISSDSQKLLSVKNYRLIILFCVNSQQSNNVTIEAKFKFENVQNRSIFGKLIIIDKSPQKCRLKCALLHNINYCEADGPLGKQTAWVEKSWVLSYSCFIGIVYLLLILAFAQLLKHTELVLHT